MDSINELLNSISPEDMAKIQSVASGLMGNLPTETVGEATGDTASASSGLGAVFSDDMSNMLLKVASQMNRDSDKTAFIKALRPLLSDERQKKADEAMHFLKLMDTLPLLRGMFQ